MKIFVLILFSTALFALESLVSYPRECRADILNIEHKLIEYIYFGHFQDKSEYLDKNGIVELKMANIDMLCIGTDSFERLGLKKDKMQDYNLKILQENSNFIFIARSKWFENLPNNAKKCMLWQ